MDVRLKPWKGNERLYFYPQTSQISSQTGLIGRLRSDFGRDGEEFWSTWEDTRGDLKTDEFKGEFDNVINSLRMAVDETPLYDRRTMAKLIRQHESAKLPGDGEWHGFRADTDNFSYFFRMQTHPGDYNFYCYCYKRDWLDSHMQEAEKGIRFITSDYEDKFRLPDGGKIKVNYPDGDSVELTCRYIDPYHLETSGPGSSSSSLWHICEFAERMEKFNETIEPVTEPMNILDVRYYCPLTMAVYERNEYGDLDDTDCTYDGRYALQYEDVISEALEREHSYDGCDEKSMATYQDNPKIRSVRFDVEDVRGTLYGCIRVGLTAPLTASEEKEFKGWLEGQCSDGFGEGFEQRELDVDDGTGYLSFWNSSNGWFMKNESEFRQYLNQNNTMKMGGM